MPSRSGCRSSPSLLGGMAVEIGDTVIDGSVRHRLDQLREALAPAGRFERPSSAPSMTVPEPDEEDKGPPQMPELTINAEDIAAALARNVSDFTAGTEAEQVGRIAEVGDGIARVTGLPGATVNELLEFENGDRRSCPQPRRGVDRRRRARARWTASTRDRSSARPAGSCRSRSATHFSGRVVNPLGEPIDGKGPLGVTIERRLEIQAPGIVSRQNGLRAAADRHQGHRRDDARSAAASASSSSATARRARRPSPPTRSSTSAAPA